MQTTNELQEKRNEFNHYVFEIFDKTLPRSSGFSKSTSLQMQRLLRKLKLNVIKTASHNFTPFGTTFVYVLSSSHMVVHTWPEYNYMHIDLFCCDNIGNQDTLTKTLENIFHTKVDVQKVGYAKH